MVTENEDPALTRSKVMAPIKSPYMVSYMSMIEMKSLSLAVFEIFVKIAF